MQVEVTCRDWTLDHDLLLSMGRVTPDLRFLALPGLPGCETDMPPFQNLHEFRCRTRHFGQDDWVLLSGCPLLESIWLSFGRATFIAADLQPVTFPALRHLILATGGKKGLMMLARISVMPLLQTAVFSAPDVSPDHSVLAHLRNTLPDTCEIEIKESEEWDEWKTLSDQLYSNGSFGRWAEDDECITEFCSESEESYSDSDDVTQDR